MNRKSWEIPREILGKSRTPRTSLVPRALDAPLGGARGREAGQGAEPSEVLRGLGVGPLRHEELLGTKVLGTTRILLGFPPGFHQDY